MYIVHSQSSFCFIVPTSRSGQKHWRAGQKRAVMNLAHDPIPGNVYFPFIYWSSLEIKEVKKWDAGG